MNENIRQGRYTILRLGARDWRVAIVTDGLRGYAPVPNEKHRRQYDAFMRCVELNRAAGIPQPCEVRTIKLKEM